MEDLHLSLALGVPFTPQRKDLQAKEDQLGHIVSQEQEYATTELLCLIALQLRVWAVHVI